MVVQALRVFVKLGLVLPKMTAGQVLHIVGHSIDWHLLQVACNTCFAQFLLVVFFSWVVNGLVIGLDSVSGNVLLISRKCLVAGQVLLVALNACFAQILQVVFLGGVVYRLLVGLDGI